MKTVLSTDAADQVEILEHLMKLGNKDYMLLYSRGALYIYELQKIDNIDDLEFGKRSHRGAKPVGRLAGELNFVASRDFDNEHRLAYFEKFQMAVVITLFGHYNIESVKQKELFQSLLQKAKKLNTLSENELKELEKENKQKLDALIKHAKTLSLIAGDLNINELKKSINNEYICPVLFEDVTKQLKNYINSSVFKQGSNFDSAFLSFFNKNNNIIERTVVNVRALSNVASVVISNGDARKGITTKLNLDKNIVRQFADLLYYINKGANITNRNQFLYSVSNQFLKGFSDSYNKNTYIKNKYLYNSQMLMDKHLKIAIRSDLHQHIINKDTSYLKNFSFKELLHLTFDKTLKLFANFYNNSKEISEPTQYLKSFTQYLNNSTDSIIKTKHDNRDVKINHTNIKTIQKGQEKDNCIEIPFSISPKDFQGVEALGAFFDKDKEKWVVPNEPKVLDKVQRFLSPEETSKRRAEEAIACQRIKEEKLKQQNQKKKKKNKGR